MPRQEHQLPEPSDEAVEIIGFPAETDPPLRDRPRVRLSRRISDRADVPVSDARAPISATGARKLVDAAASAKAVQPLIGRDFVAIGGHRLDAKDGRASVVVLYSYTHQWAVEARQDKAGAEWTTRVMRTQPPLTDEEIELVVSLAREALDADVADLEAGAMAIMREEPEDPLAGRRLADVRFFPADQRLATYAAIVDVADRKTVRAGRLEGGDHG